MGSPDADDNWTSIHVRVPAATRMSSPAADKVNRAERSGSCACRKSHPCRLSGMPILVEDAAEAVASVDVEPGDGGRLGNR
jgi:hypothetical protein